MPRICRARRTHLPATSTTPTEEHCETPTRTAFPYVTPQPKRPQEKQLQHPVMWAWRSGAVYSFTLQGGAESCSWPGSPSGLRWWWRSVGSRPDSRHGDAANAHGRVPMPGNRARPPADARPAFGGLSPFCRAAARPPGSDKDAPGSGVSLPPVVRTFLIAGTSPQRPAGWLRRLRTRG